jgi:hypothetical protein
LFQIWTKNKKKFPALRLTAATGHALSRPLPPAAGALVPADGDGATADLLAVHPQDGVLHRLLVIENDEPEATGPPCLASSMICQSAKKVQNLTANTLLYPNKWTQYLKTTAIYVVHHE